MDDAVLKALEYPRHLHKPSVPGAWVYLVVRDHYTCAAALSDGWSLTPILLGAESAGIPPPAASQPSLNLPTVEPPPPPEIDEPKRRGWPKGKPRKVTP